MDSDGVLHLRDGNGELLVVGVTVDLRNWVIHSWLSAATMMV